MERKLSTVAEPDGVVSVEFEPELPLEPLEPLLPLEPLESEELAGASEPEYFFAESEFSFAMVHGEAEL